MKLSDRIQDLNYDLLKLSSLVETNIKDAFSAIGKKDLDKSQIVINNDSKINMMEVEIEKEVNEIIEKFHPTDSDLRYLLAALKINNELERIGDYATNIARNTQFMVEHPDLELPNILSNSAETLTAMLNEVINAFILSDEAKGHHKCHCDGRPHKHVCPGKAVFHPPACAAGTERCPHARHDGHNVQPPNESSGQPFYRDRSGDRPH